MAHRRLSSAEKGKGVDLGNYEPPRAARVKAPLPDNSELLRKHSLTLIGRVTNKSTQKVWSLIPFFTEHWKTEFKPVGADLGNGLFQFQFELESDLLQVLEQRPYHYARWLIILQRWEPTVSPSFPSLIPFWIKVQGLPVHLWTEPIVKCIGGNIGLYEKAEITSLTVRMRVHVNGLLPLITKSVVEFPNGDEVSTTLVYERLDKHCTKCLRLDHELKECLVARAEAKALKANHEETRERNNPKIDQDSDSIRGYSMISAHESQARREQDYQNREAFKFVAPSKGNERERRPPTASRGHLQNRNYKSQSQTWQEKGAQRRSSQSRERAQPGYERNPRFYREDSRYDNLPGPPNRGIYREIRKQTPEPKETGSSASKNLPANSNRGGLQGEESILSKKNAELESRRKEKEMTLSHHRESAQVDKETGSEGAKHSRDREHLEEAVLQVVRASLNLTEERRTPPIKPTPPRAPMSQRLGNTDQNQSASAGKNTGNSASNSKDRTPASMRLGSSEHHQRGSSGKIAEDQASSRDRIPATQRLKEMSSPNSQSRVPAALRLGPDPSQSPSKKQKEQIPAKRKPGRPPGRVKIPASPSRGREATAKRRRVPNPKVTKSRRKTIGEESRVGGKRKKDLQMGESSRPAATGGNSHSSDNIPLSNMIPKSNRRKADFRVPSAPVP